MKYLVFLFSVSILLSGCVTTQHDLDSSPITLLLQNRITNLEKEFNLVKNSSNSKEVISNELKVLTDKIQIHQNNINDIKEDIIELKRKPVERNIEPQTVIVWIKMKNNSRKPITMKRIGDNWIGPGGEYYDDMPSEKDLKILYRE